MSLALSVVMGLEPSVFSDGMREPVTSMRCIGAVDVALWDLAGKVANLPIHRMLGSFRESVPAYASSEVLPSKEAYAEEAARARLLP